MEEDQKSKHRCKFCYKMFPCGRSLGGHMRSHLINISSSEKKLPPLTKHKHNGRIDLSVEDGYNPKKTRKISDSKVCKECGKTFHSWKALFGHMKCHSVIEQGDSWSDDHKPISDNLSSDSEAALCRRKRSHRPKRHTNTDQQEQEEVALSLILLSMDSMSSVFESLDGKKTPKVSCSDDTKSSSADVKFKFLNEAEFRAPRKRLKSSEKYFECEEEVTSPKTLMIKNPFGSSSDHNKKKNHKFTCIICKKGFPSYQALGGHRASHKKFKGCCAPTTTSSHETPAQEENIECKKSKEHHCPICFKIFPSGQALGGHKRSHMITDHANNTTHPSLTTERRIPQIRGFIDLNLPAPLEEDCNDFKPWWIGNTHKHQHEPLLTLLSSS
ncbi:hypothetical protein C2S51_028848 [Perilla frutescens var. frutescens]|nr:hypothetical protein C2S51_028848 [Perilla frutescens var. frutescens]